MQNEYRCKLLDRPGTVGHLHHEGFISDKMYKFHLEWFQLQNSQCYQYCVKSRMQPESGVLPAKVELIFLALLAEGRESHELHIFASILLAQSAVDGNPRSFPTVPG